MKLIRIFKIAPLFILVSCVFLGFKLQPEISKYKCMIQMKNYTGEGAYIVISLLNPEGFYEKTLYVQGDDEEWYFDIYEWWQFQGKVRHDIDAITGATISGGARAISIIEIENIKLDKGYKIRFESAVEDQDYFKDDVEFELTSETIKSKIEGNGFIRYIRMIPQ
ncbi:flagellin biosynthesis protein FlgD [Flavobacteriales bacterium 33_180_T64]|nr:flagellin biosynthesis protein FlgD [Flavobacteriales bacterium 33_180_T64]